MDSRDRLVRDFEAVTAEVNELERRLTEARGRQDRLRRTLRTALKGTSSAEENGAVEPPGAAMETVEAISKLGEPADATKLAEQLGVSPSIARTRLQRAAGLGLLRRVKRGYYEVVPAAE